MSMRESVWDQGAELLSEHLERIADAIDTFTEGDQGFCITEAEFAASDCPFRSRTIFFDEVLVLVEFHREAGQLRYMSRIERGRSTLRESPTGLMARQQAEALGDHAGLPREALEIFDDQVKALAPEPVERVQHGLGGPVHPSLVHVHGRELAQERAVLSRAPPGMVRHQVVGRIEMKPVPGRHATGDGRLAGTAPATDPVDVPELRTQRCGMSRGFDFCHLGPPDPDDKLMTENLWRGDHNAGIRAASWDIMVGLGRLELPTSSLSGKRSNRLSYRPMPLAS